MGLCRMLGDKATQVLQDWGILRELTGHTLTIGEEPLADLETALQALRSYEAAIRHGGPAGHDTCTPSASSNEPLVRVEEVVERIKQHHQARLSQRHDPTFPPPTPTHPGPLNASNMAEGDEKGPTSAVDRALRQMKRMALQSECSDHGGNDIFQWATNHRGSAGDSNGGWTHTGNRYCDGKCYKLA